MSTALSVRPKENNDFFTLSSSNQLIEQMQTLHDEIARTAFGFFEGRGGAQGSPLGDWLRAESQLLKYVPVSIQDEKDHLTVTADVPGFSMDQIKVHVDGQNLKICGKAESSSKAGKRQTSSSRRICCEVNLPATVKADSASAALDKGVLTMILPKAELPHEIEAKAAA